MIRNVITVIGIGLFFAGGALFVRDSINSPKQTNELLENIQEAASANPLDLELASLAGPYSIQLSTNGDPTGDITAHADVDARGNIQTIINEQGTENVFIHVEGNTYIKLPGDEAWLKFSSGSGDSTFSADDIDIGYNKADIEALGDVNQTGKDTCTLGRCRIYTAKNPVTNEDMTIKVEDSLNRLSDISLMAINGKKTTLIYSYDNAIATISPPTQFKEFYSSGTGVSSP